MKRIFIFSIAILSNISLFSQNKTDLFNEALNYYNDKNYHKSIELLNDALQKDDQFGNAYFIRCLSRLCLGDIRSAESDLILAEKYGAKGMTNYDQLSKIVKFLGDDEYKLSTLRKYYHYYEGEKLTAANGYRPIYTRKDSLRGSLRPERTCFDVTFYDLSLKIMPSSKRISGENQIYFKVIQPTKKIQIDLFDRYKIEKILWNNKELAYHREYDVIFVDFPETLSVGSSQIVRVIYSGKPQKAINPPWEGGFVWKKDEKGNRFISVACEHLGASSWWPCKDHPSDEPDSMRMSFITPNGYDLVSNGRLQSEEKSGKGFTKHTWFVRNPINNYLVSFYLGKYTHFSDTIINAEGSYPLDFYVLPFHLEDAKKVFPQAKDVLKCYEKYFGEFPFPQDKYSLVESPYEGMEHQGAIAYGNGYNKHKSRTLHSDYDYIIVHETAHEWWGNSVTASDMADMWIQEGFATYAELLFVECRYDYNAYLKELTNKMFEVYNFWPIVQNYGVNENSFASNDVYHKAAAMLNNLRCAIDNDEIFFKIIKDFATKYKKKVVTSDDFVKIVNEESGKNFTPFFHKFLKDKNLPILKYKYKIQGDDIVLDYKWDEVEKGFFMPICIKAGTKNLRLVPTTEPQSIRIKDVDSFHFYNFILGSEGVEKNSYTYYWTHCEN